MIDNVEMGQLLANARAIAKKNEAACRHIDDVNLRSRAGNKTERASCYRPPTTHELAQTHPVLAGLLRKYIPRA